MSEDMESYRDIIADYLVRRAKAHMVAYKKETDASRLLKKEAELVRFGGRHMLKAIEKRRKRVADTVRIIHPDLVSDPSNFPERKMSKPLQSLIRKAKRK